MAQSKAPPAARRSNPVGTPAPASRIRRLRHGKAAKHVTLHETWYLCSRHAAYYAKTFFVTKLWPAAWRNKDRTCLALVPLAFVLAGPLAAVAALPLAGLGWDHYRARARQTRRVTAANRHLQKQVVFAPRVQAVTECHAPRLERGPRGDTLRLGPARLTAPRLAASLDRLRPLVHRPELVSEYHVLEVPPGIHPDDYDRMKVTLGARYRTSLTFDRSSADPSRVTMRIQRADWLARRCPWIAEPCTPMRLPVGMNWDGRWEHDSIHDQAWLIAGQRGAGKTAFLRGLLGRLWNMDQVELWLADHLQDLEEFEAHSARYTGTLDGALGLLDDFVASHAKANAARAAAGLKYLSWPEHPCKILAVDELGALTTHPDKAVREHVLHSLYIIATQGRKTAHSLLAATQHPSAEVLPTAIRGQFTRRLALKLGEASEVRMALNIRDASRYDCTAIPEEHRGRGWWKRDGRAVQLRTPGLYDHDLSWLFAPENPSEPHGRWWETPATPPQETPADSETAAPPTPLHLVPDISKLTNEDRFRRALAEAPPTGFTIEDVHRLTSIPRPTLYRYVKLPGVQVVRSVQPRSYRLSAGSRRAG